MLASACHPAVRPTPTPVARPPVVHRPPPLSVLEDGVPPRLGTRLTCPVCGDEYALAATQPVRYYRGRVFLFCCQRCLPHFDKDPELIHGEARPAKTQRP